MKEIPSYEKPRLGYICKYVPVEALEACGIQVCRIEPQAADLCRADTLMHANVCSFVRAVLEDFAGQDYDGMVLTTCCDSARRLYDTLCANWPDRFFYCLDLPHKVNDFAASLYEKQIRRMLDAWDAYQAQRTNAPHTPSAEQVRRALTEQAETPVPGQADTLLRSSFDDSGIISVGLAGARIGDSVRQLLIDRGIRIRFNMTCTGAPRSFDLTAPVPGLPAHADENNTDILRRYSHLLLNQIPCMRMADASGRQRYFRDMAEQVDGIIYHTVKFCDIYSYEYAQLNKTVRLPVLKIETDATAQSSGQILTRLEAFIESLEEGKKEHGKTGAAALTAHKKKGASMIVMGIDSGSTSTNAVLLDEKKEILSAAVLRTGARSADSAARVRAMVLEQAGISAEDVDLTVSTGYGRVSIPFADRDITEISCHAKGAHFLNPEIRTILDIGGQDSKAIHLDESGAVKDFVMNDKCAAGTGRFLEMMARTLEIPITELGPLSLQSAEALTISSMCTVFAESEVISLIAQNKEPADIAHGIHEAIVSRAMSLIRRVGAEPGFMMTGGVAKNEGVVDVLKKRLGAPVWRYEEPEIVGALGAALYGLEER